MIQQWQDVYKVERMAKVLGVSRSGYYAFQGRGSNQQVQDQERLLERIKKIHQESRGLYGSPRIHAVLKAQGETCSRPRVARLMKSAGIAAYRKKPWKVTTQPKAGRPCFPNLVARDFKVLEPNTVWVGDITYIGTLEGWLYLAIVLDLFSRRIVGMAMSDRLKTPLVLDALRQALRQRKGRDDVIHHSDRGAQYTSDAFGVFATSQGVRLSMSETGNCYDNAVAESFFHTLKTELVHQTKFRTREEARIAIFEYVEVFYNRKRIHSTLGYVTPDAFEQSRVK